MKSLINKICNVEIIPPTPFLKEGEERNIRANKLKFFALFILLCITLSSFAQYSLAQSNPTKSSSSQSSDLKSADVEPSNLENNKTSVYPERPNPPKLVNDFASLMKAEDSEKLEAKLFEYEKSSTNQIAIVTIPTLQDEEIGAYAPELFHRWGIGQKGKDNGVLILVALKERKMFIATGYGVEAILTDAICKRIIEEILKPNFIKADFFTAFDQASDQIIKLLGGESMAAAPPPEKSFGELIPLIIFLIFFFLNLFSGFGGRRTYGRRGSFMGPIFYGGSSSYGDFSSGGGSFGGFGGGDSGGGGAGGSW